MSPHPSLVAITCLLALASCGEKEEIVEKPAVPEPKIEEPFNQKDAPIGVSLDDSDEFSSEVVESMKAEAAKHGYKTKETPTVEFQSLIESKVQAIVISSDDLAALEAEIQTANSEGIPVFTFGEKSSESAAEIVSHIGTNFFEGGELAAQAMIEALGESGGEILILNSGEADHNAPQIRGFKNVIERFNSSRPEGKLSILATDSPSDTAASMLLDHPELAGIFALSESTALDVVSDLEKVGKQDVVTVIGFDLGEAGKTAISAGKIYAAPTPSAEQIGIAVAEAIAEHLAGENVPAEQLVDMKLHRRADASAESENTP